jgi:hypothetical protein
MAITTTALAQSPERKTNRLGFASDFQTIPVAANVPGVGGTFQSYVAILNPTSSAFIVTASLYDTNGTKRTASINLAAGELKTYANFLDAVFQSTGGGAVTLQSPNPNNRFIVDSEVRTGGTHYGTSVPVVEFAGTNSRSFAPGITVDSTARTNIGCFNQSSATNAIHATVLDATGKVTAGGADLSLPPNAWGQINLSSVVSGGTVQFDPTEAALCYAVVVDNSNNDGRFIMASEYKP